MRLSSRRAAFSPISDLLEALRARARVLALLVALVSAIGRLAPEPPSRADLTQVRKVATPLRSIDPEERDFSDLAPLAAAIGPARVVVLGEASHGDGATHLAKCRVVRFLRESMGFDVVIFECGTYDGWAMDRAFDAGMDVHDALALGVPPFWSSSGQAQPVFGDAWDSYFTDAPLAFAGFAPERTGRRTARQLPRDLLDFFAPLPEPAFTEARRRELLTVIDRLEQAEFSGDADDLVRVLDDLADIDAALEQHAPALADLHGAGDVEAWRRFVGDQRWAVDRALTADLLQPAEMASYNDRAERLADNLLWLVNERFAGRKVIVWCSTWHALAAPDAVRADPRPAAIAGAVTPGTRWRAELGPGLFTLAFSARGGATGWAAGPPPVAWPAAPTGSLEDLIATVSGPFAFVHLAALPAEHPLRRPLVSALSGVGLAMRGHGDRDLRLTADWGAQVDGIICLSDMFAASPNGGGPDGAILTRPAPVEPSEPQEIRP